MVARNWRKKLASKAETTKLTIRVKCSCSSPFFFSFRGRKRRARHFVFYTLKDTRKLRTRKRCVRYVRLRNSQNRDVDNFHFSPFLFSYLLFSLPRYRNQLRTRVANLIIKGVYKFYLNVARNRSLNSDVDNTTIKLQIDFPSKRRRRYVKIFIQRLFVDSKKKKKKFNIRR